MLFLKALLIGLLIAAPVGPIGMLCIQRSLTRGWASGFATGLGAACADAFYGLLGALGVASIVAALPTFALVLRLAGGLFLLWIAYSIAKDARKALTAAQDTQPASSHWREFVTTLLLTLSNPMTIFSFIAIFASIGALPSDAAAASRPWLAVIPMVLGVFFGSAAWWLFLSGASAAVRKKMPDAWVHGIAWLSAAAIAVFGVVQLIQGLEAL